MIGIYAIKNKINNKMYIGKSINIENRWREHVKELNNNRHYNTYLQASWNKYKEDNFQFLVIEECSSDELNEKEIYWINYYGGSDNTNLFNLAEGGSGGAMNSEVRLKMSESIRKSKIDNPTRNFGESNGMYKKQHTLESREKMSIALKGRVPWNKGLKHSEETKVKISEKLKGRTYNDYERYRRSVTMKNHYKDLEFKNKIKKLAEKRRKYSDDFIKELQLKYEETKSIKEVALLYNMNYEVCRLLIRNGSTH